MRAPTHLHHGLRQADRRLLARDRHCGGLKALIDLDTGSRVLLQRLDGFACRGECTRVIAWPLQTLVLRQARPANSLKRCVDAGFGWRIPKGSCCSDCRWTTGCTEPRTALADDTADHGAWAVHHTGLALARKLQVHAATFAGSCAAAKLAGVDLPTGAQRDCPSVTQWRCL